MQVIGDIENSEMLLPDEHRMAQLNEAYVMAVSAVSGATYDPPKQDYGIDGRISEVRRFPTGEYRSTNWQFNCQLKATTNFVLEENYIVYKMKVEAYNRLVSVGGNTSRILIIFCLPKEWENWVTLSEENLILKHCCYWDFFTGSPSINKESITVRIPRQNIFNPEAVQKIFENIKRGEDPNGFAS